jgi:hypothetical protein
VFTISQSRSYARVTNPAWNAIVVRVGQSDLGGSHG